MRSFSEEWTISLLAYALKASFMIEVSIFSKFFADPFLEDFWQGKFFSSFFTSKVLQILTGMTYSLLEDKLVFSVASEGLLRFDL